MRSFCLIFFVYFVQILAEAKELSRVHTLAASDSKIDPLLQSKWVLLIGSLPFQKIQDAEFEQLAFIAK